MDNLAFNSLNTALFAVFYEAKVLGFDIDAIADAAKAGLLDGSKPYRGGFANQVVPASEAIEEALKNAKSSFVN